MARLTANEIHSLEAKKYDGKFWVTVEFKGRTVKVEGYSRSDETDEEMREAGYVYIENSCEYGKELWISVEDLYVN